MSLPLSKKFLTQFCDPKFRMEWTRLEQDYHDADTWAFYQMRGRLISTKNGVQNANKRWVIGEAYRHIQRKVPSTYD